MKPLEWEAHDRRIPRSTPTYRRSRASPEIETIYLFTRVHER